MIDVGNIEMGGGDMTPPFVLYNMRDKPSGKLAGRGTSGSKFNAIYVPEPWDGYFNDHTHTPDGPSESPFISSAEDFGGSWCDGPITFFFVSDQTAGGMWGEWYIYGENWNGWLLQAEVDLSDNYVYINLWNSAYPGNALDIFYHEVSWPESFQNSDDGRTVVMISADAGHDLSNFQATVNGNPVASSYLQAFGSCSQLMNGGYSPLYNGGPPYFHGYAEYPAPYGAIDIYGWDDINVSSGISTHTAFHRGWGWFRGVPTDADYEYWRTYDWASHPGFA